MLDLHKLPLIIGAFVRKNLDSKMFKNNNNGTGCFIEPENNTLIFGGWRPVGVVFKTVIVCNEEAAINKIKNFKPTKK